MRIGRCLVAARLAGALVVVAFFGASCGDEPAGDDDAAGGEGGGSSGAFCESSLDCVEGNGGRTICDPLLRACVECVASADCPDMHDCTEHACVPYTTCNSSLDCPLGEVCHDEWERCVECVRDADCDEGERCADSECRPPCDSDNDCTPLGLLCDQAGGYCVRCLEHSHCAELEHCARGDCVADVCRADVQSCSGNALATCDDEGTMATLTPCAADESCRLAGNGASCVASGEGGAGGEPGTGGSSGTGGGSGGRGTTGGAGGASGGTGGSGGSGGALGGGAGAINAGGTAGAGAGGGTGGAESGGTSGSSGASGSGGTAGAGGGGPVAGPSCESESGDECQGESCCTSLVVPGGSYLRGRGTEICSTCVDGCPTEGEGCDTDELPETTITISAFALDKYEVTAGRYLAFVAAFDAWRAGGQPADGVGGHPLVPGSGWNSGWNTLLAADSATLTTRIESCSNSTVDGGNATDPMNCVDFYEAFAFCAWDGGHLPTDAQWEFAAAGGDENRLYPWGSAVPDATLAVFDTTGPLIVGSLAAGAGRYGHRDLMGNVWEYMLDLYAPYPSGCNDCVNVTTGTNRTLRGGSYGNAMSTMRAANRYDDGRPATDRTNSTGFRCAR